MTEDSVHTSDIILRESRAIATADVSFAMASTGQDIPQPETGPKKHVRPAKSMNNPNLMTQQFLNMDSIDVTDTHWHAVPIWKQTSIENWAVQPPITKVRNVFQMLDMRFYHFFGVPTHDLVSHDSTNAAHRITYDENIIGQYTMLRFKGANITIGNFCITCERDGSGGIQILDNLIFEVQMIPVKTYSGDLENYGGLTDAPFSTYLSDLKEGFNFAVGPSAGAQYLSDYYFHATNDNKQKVYVYPMYKEWVMNNAPFKVQPADYSQKLYARVQEHGLMYRMYLRLVNMPQGTTTIKVKINYTAELHSYWDAMGFLEDAAGILPDHGAAVPTNLKQKEIHQLTKKRLFSLVQDHRGTIQPQDSEHRHPGKTQLESSSEVSGKKRVDPSQLTSSDLARILK